MFTLGPGLRGGVGDPYIANVTLLLPLNGDLVDVMGHGFSTVGGSFVLDGPWGTQARDIGAPLPSGGGGNCLYSTDPSVDWWLDGGDFSIEITAMKNMPSNSGRPRPIIRLAEFATSRDYLAIGMSTSITPITAQIRDGLTSSNSFTSSFTPADGVWHRYHFRRIGNSHTLHVDENLVLSFSNSYRAASAAVAVYIGNNTPNFVDGFSGRVKEVRITKGVARPIETPTGPFPRS